MGVRLPLEETARRYLDRALDEVKDHLRELNITMKISIAQSEFPDSYLFRGLFTPPDIYVPIAVLTSDGKLHFFTGTISIDLKLSTTEIPEALLGSDTL